MDSVDAVELVKTVYFRFTLADIPGVLELLEPEVSWQIYGPAGYPFFGSFRGHSEFQSFIAALVEVTEITGFEPDRFVSSGDIVIVTGKEEARIKRNGAPYTTNWCQIFRVRQGKIASFEEYTDSGAIIAAFEQD